MWLLLEYDKYQREEAVAHLQKAGISVTEIWREDQLHQVDMKAVTLILVGREWKPETLSQIREMGADAHAVYVTVEGDENPEEQAHRLGGRDYVFYPLTIPYLLAWSKEAGASASGVAATRSMSPLESILQRRRSQVENKTTYTAPKTVDMPIQQARGRVVLFHSVAGGVGKSVLASLTAGHLAARNYQAVVVDLVPQGILLNMHRGSSFVTMDEWARLPNQMDERMVRQSLVQTSSGFWVLPSGVHRQALAVETVRKVLVNLATVFDVVLLDTVHDDSVGTRAAMEMAHHIMYVMAPEWVSFKRNVDEIGYLLKQKGERGISVVVNRVRQNTGEHRRTLRVLEEAQLEEVKKTFVPDDKTLYRQIINGAQMTGSRIVQSQIRELVGAFGFESVASVAPKQKRRLLK